MKKRNLLLAFLLAFLAVICLAGCVNRELKKQQPVNLKVRGGKCGQTGSWSPWKDQVDQVSWTDQDELIITATVTSICTAGGWVGNYVIEDDNHLILEHQESRLGSSACLCPFELRYKIKDIERKDYTVSIRPME